MALSSYVCLDRETMRKIETMHRELVQAVEHVAGLLATPPVLQIGASTPVSGAVYNDPDKQPVYGTWSCTNRDCRVLEFEPGSTCPNCGGVGR